MHKNRRSNVIVIDRELVLSKAYLSLRTASSHVVLMIFMSKRQMEKLRTSKREQWAITNNGEIKFTYAEAKNTYGISQFKFGKAIDDVIEKGFIDIAGTGMGVHKVTTLYAISDRWKKYGTAEFEKRERPKGPINRGFEKGNQLGRNCRQNRQPNGEPAGESCSEILGHPICAAGESEEKKSTVVD